MMMKGWLLVVSKQIHLHLCHRGQKALHQKESPETHDDVYYNVLENGWIMLFADWCWDEE